MAHLHNNSKGFAVVELLVLLVLFSGLIGIGYYVFKQNSNDTNTSRSQASAPQDRKKTDTVTAKDEQKVEPYKSVIAFKDNGSLTEDQKKEIRLKLAEPLSFYHFKNLNIPLKEVTVQKGGMSGYALSYVYAENPETNTFGFVFNADNIKYWQPQLCDHGGCNPYPESLKAAYPNSYEAYQSCQTAQENKEKQNSLGCDYTN